MRIRISDKQFERAYRSANLWFVALYMEAFLGRINELEDDIRRVKFIEEIYNNGDNTSDKDESGTRTRVDSLWRIIRSGRTIEALKVVVNSDKLRKTDPISVETAEELLSRIKSGEIVIPERYCS